MEEKTVRWTRAGTGCVKTELECLPCFFRQVKRTLAYAGVNGDKGKEITRVAERIIEAESLDQAPARISTHLHRLIRERSGTDPYKSVKSAYNRIALDLLPEVRNRVLRDKDPLAGAVRAAIAGNIIDFGIYESVDLAQSLEESFLMPFSMTDYPVFADAVAKASSVLYLCDNAGEIVFDRVLIETLQERGKTVTVAVKGIPVINDATREDALEAGLENSAVRLIDNGNDGIGTLLEMCSPDFLEVYRAADLIVSKGQANYETLVNEGDGRTFFLFKVKCPVVAAALNRNNGDIMLLQSGSKTA